MKMEAEGGESTRTKAHQMKAKRRRHDPEFKARVAMEALKGVKTIQQIAREYEIHPVQVSEWKKIMADGAVKIFGPGRSADSEPSFTLERDSLHSKIGQLTVEVDFLRKKSRQLGL